MIARTLSVDVGPERLDDVVRAYRDVVRPVHEHAEGLLAHLVLINREAGRLTIVGVWDSAESVAAIADELEPARQRLWDAFGRRPDLDIYDVADEIGIAASST
jgi:hypothetical protein